jgi:copper chaperone
MPGFQSVTLGVPDVSCEHCVSAIKGALQGQPGIDSVDVNLETKTVSCRFDPEVISQDALEEILDETGYPVAG